MGKRLYPSQLQCEAEAYSFRISYSVEESNKLTASYWSYGHSVESPGHTGGPLRWRDSCQRAANRLQLGENV